MLLQRLTQNSGSIARGISAACIAVLISNPGHPWASTLDISIKSDPARLAGTILNLGNFAPQFSVCLNQMNESFDAAQSTECRYSFNRMDEIANAFHIRRIPPSDIETFKSVLIEMKRIHETSP